MVNLTHIHPTKKDAVLGRSALLRIAVSTVLIILAIGAFNSIPASSGHDEPTILNPMASSAKQDQQDHVKKTHVPPQAAEADHSDNKSHTDTAPHDSSRNAGTVSTTDTDTSHTSGDPSEKTTHTGKTESDHTTTGESPSSAQPSEARQNNQDSTHNLPSDTEHQGRDKSYSDLPTGVSFVEAAIKPLDYELNHRFWGWRPNDIVNLTDNVNNFQLGVLEVTRRTVMLLAERISRTGTTDAFNPHLENSMNWLMVKASRYWFPAPEAKYKESIKELEAYKQNLINGVGSFYTRTDNLIPLLSSYEDLLGSCDENLVKQQNSDDSNVSTFKADDYFYYAQGVASTLASVLEAVHHDFLSTLESRHAAELLHHALESCRQAAALDPILITNGDLDGILANHRANMAAPISHARFYIGQLIKTLST